MLVAFLAIPLIGLTRSLTWSKRVQLLLAACLAIALLMAPWTIRNLTTFRDPVFVSANGDAVLGFANCDAVYSGPFIGLWYKRCPSSTPTGDESEVAKAYRDMGLHYIPLISTGSRSSSPPGSGGSGRSTSQCRTSG